MSKEKLQKLYKELADKFELPVPIIRNVVQHQFSFVREKMVSDEMPDIRLHYLGVFCIKKGRIDHFIRIALNQYKKKKINKEELRSKLKKLFILRKKFKKK